MLMLLPSEFPTEDRLHTLGTMLMVRTRYLNGWTSYANLDGTLQVAVLQSLVRRGFQKRTIEWAGGLGWRGRGLCQMQERRPPAREPPGSDPHSLLVQKDRIPGPGMQPPSRAVFLRSVHAYLKSKCRTCVLVPRSKIN